MTEIGFYHLQGQTLDDALPKLLEKLVERGMRVTVETTSAERAAALDERLWPYSEPSFLPHALAAGRPGEASAADDRQPVLITADAGVGSAPVRVLVDGARLPDALDAYERVMLFFDGDDAEAVAEARAQWRTVKAKGLPATYWLRAPGGGWKKQG